jgi:hypothetical protein
MTRAVSLGTFATGTSLEIGVCDIGPPAGPTGIEVGYSLEPESAVSYRSVRQERSRRESGYQCRCSVHEAGKALNRRGLSVDCVCLHV